MVGYTLKQGFPGSEDCWIQHPDPSVDLCMLPMGEYLRDKAQEGYRVYTRYVDETLIASRDDIAGLAALEPIVMVGYPTGLLDEKHNLPIFRQGIAATDPRVDFDGRKEFVIDAPCFPGSSSLSTGGSRWFRFLHRRSPSPCPEYR